MAAQKGKALLIKIGDGQDPESFTTVAGLRSTTITLNDEAVDITTKDNAPYRTLLAQAGIQTVSVSGSGVFTDSAVEETVRAKMGASTFSNYQIIVPDFGTYEGEFMLASLEYAGEYNGEVTYSMTFESSGQIAYTAE